MFDPFQIKFTMLQLRSKNYVTFSNWRGPHSWPIPQSIILNIHASYLRYLKLTTRLQSLRLKNHEKGLINFINYYFWPIPNYLPCNSWAYKIREKFTAATAVLGKNIMKKVELILSITMSPQDIFPLCIQVTN